MEKFLSILERHVQWIALALGALFLAYVAYNNVAETPSHLTVDVGGRKVQSGDVASAIASGDSFRRLQEGMKNERKIEFRQIDPVEELKKNVFAQVDRPPTGPSGPNPPPGGPNAPGPGPTQFAVNSLPKPPPAEVQAYAFGRSVVLPPPPALPGDPGAFPPGQAPGLNPFPPPAGGNPFPAPAGGDIARPVMPGQPGIPGQPGVPAAPVGEDKDWVTVSARIDMKALDKEFERAGIPKLQMQAQPGGAAFPMNPGQRDTYVSQFLRVWLIRQEQNSAGQWDAKSDKVIPLPERLEAMKLPPNDGSQASVQQAFMYMQWVTPNLGHMFQPAFPEVTAGDPWYYPGQPKPQPQLAPGAAPPAFAPPPPLSPGPRPAAPAPSPFGRPRSSYGGGTGFDPGRSGYEPPRGFVTVAYGPAPAGGPSASPFPPPSGGTGYGPGYSPGYTPGYNPGFEGGATPGAVTPNGVPGTGSPDGRFNVSQAATVMPVFEFWAHDLTAEPGKKYRYRMRYAILNPVFQGFALAPANLANQFALVADPGPWGGEVEVPQRVEFYVRNQTMNAAGSKAHLDLFTWKGGGWTIQQVDVVPGDPIGDSKWVVVDLRMEAGRNGKPYMLAADPSSQLVRRSAREDEQNPQYQQRKLETQGPPPAPGTGGPVAAPEGGPQPAPPPLRRGPAGPGGRTGYQ
jgi:hypothetical protein